MPSSHLDFVASKLFLLDKDEDLKGMLHDDPFFFDAKIAGLWAYIMCTGIDIGTDLALSKVTNAIQCIGATKGCSITKSNTYWDASNWKENDEYRLSGERLHGWFRRLAERLRFSEILCKDWSDLYSRSMLGQVKGMPKDVITGIFLDPPYQTDGLKASKYKNDSSTIAADVMEKAIELGENPRNRVILAGYEKDYEMPDSWQKEIWRGDGIRLGSTKKADYSRAEALWYSPHCLQVEQANFFDAF